MECKILLVDDEEILRVSLQDILKKEGYEVIVAEDGQKGWQKFQAEKPFLVLTDLKMPGMDGIALLQKIKEVSPETVVIMITAYGTIPTAVQAMKLGAYDYVTKPFPSEDIIYLIKRALELYSLNLESIRPVPEWKNRRELNGIIGRNEKMQRVYQLIENVAKTSVNVLIQGETGTGKELVAKAIHALSPRRDKPLIKVSCAGLPETLLESELFGYEKGAFTDAVIRKIGRFEMANEGTLFLDDVDDISLSTQVKLLRVLQEREFERVGGTETIQIDIRLVAATKKDLYDLVSQSKFRDDLYYRLNVVSFAIPPLRERKDDIPLLVNCFLEKYGRKYHQKISISEDPLTLLAKYDWPGNVRELENMIERVTALSDRAEIGPADLSFIWEKNLQKADSKVLREILKGVERDHIIKVLTETKNKKEDAAKLLGISRKTLWQKIKEYGIE